MAAKGRNTGERAVAALLVRNVRKALKDGDCGKATTLAHRAVHEATTRNSVYFDGPVSQKVRSAIKRADAKVQKVCGIAAYRAAARRS